MAEDQDTKAIDVESRERVSFEMHITNVLRALQDVATAELTAGNGITANAWRELHNAVTDALGGDQLAHAVPVPGRPAMVVPPARGGAVQVPHRPPMAMPPGPRTQIPIGAPVSVVPPGDIRKREDVAAELDRISKRGGK